MKRYEGLFILDLSGKEEGIKEVVDKLSAEIASVGGKIETVQKLEKKTFARNARSGESAGHFVNIIFEAQGKAVAELRCGLSKRQVCVVHSFNTDQPLRGRCGTQVQTFATKNRSKVDIASLIR